MVLPGENGVFWRLLPLNGAESIAISIQIDPIFESVFIKKAPIQPKQEY